VQDVSPNKNRKKAEQLLEATKATSFLFILQKIPLKCQIRLSKEVIKSKSQLITSVDSI